ncbi:MAG TPA: class I SAM-dependent methyltransferase [Usitatibacter sp.]|nr:class I SAM-dependent methyltransferase [Usitatibacter sp.]
MNDLPFTGERFIPGTPGEIWIEHWHRYHFATRWAAGKRVLDVACGEGYGSALLARHAREVTGVDVAPAAVAHARGVYAGVANLRFVEASCTQLPLGDASFDLVVSFETLEHIGEQERFLDEIARVLAPGGILLLSSPDKHEYSDRRDFVNEFHVKELYRDELRGLVSARFAAIDWYGQKATFYSLIAPEGGADGVVLTEVDEQDPSHAGERLSNPLYFVLACARNEASLRAVAPVTAVLADRSEWVHRDYEKVMRWLTECVAQREQLQREAAAREAAHGAALDAAASAARAQAQRLRDEAQGHARDAEAARAQAESLRRQLESTAHELARARTWRGWLRQPWVRLGWLKPRP